MLLALDYDGVLIDSIDEMIRITNFASSLIGTGRMVSSEDFQAIEDLTFENVGKFIGIPEEKLAYLRNQFFQVLSSTISTSKVFEEMPQVVVRLAKNHTVVLITSNIRESVERVLKKNELTSSISGILDAKDPGRKSDKLLRAITDFKSTAKETLMVGDTISDIRQGKLAGVKTAAVTWGFQMEETLSKECPDYIAHHPFDLIKIVEELSKPNLADHS